MLNASPPLLSDPILSDALAQALANNPALENITLECVGILLKLRMPPNLIFGFIKTGFLATEENLDSFSAAELLLWHQAQMEYAAITDLQTN